MSVAVLRALKIGRALQPQITKGQHSSYFCGDICAGRTYSSPPWARDANGWNVAAQPNIVRNYHSVSLLMPDGRVWTAVRISKQSRVSKGASKKMQVSAGIRVSIIMKCKSQRVACPAEH